MSATHNVFSSEQMGTVCLGKNLSKVSSEHSDRLYIKIGDSSRIYFLRPYSGPGIVLKNLDIKKDFSVSIFFDDEVTQSWKLNFSKLKTESVLIWRSAGSWRMEPNKVSTCN